MSKQTHGQPMNDLVRPGARTVLRCARDGGQLQVLQDNIGLEAYVTTGTDFTSLTDGMSRDKATRFLRAVAADGVSFNWEINLTPGGRLLPMRFTGVLLDDSLVLLGQVADAMDSVQLNAMSGLMNEMGVLQRDLARKNKDLQDEVKRREEVETRLRTLNDTLEQQVAERTEKLAQQNSELEAFVYCVSHDLSTPLVTITGFASLLQRDIERGDRAAMHDSVMEIKKACVTLTKHIRDLLLLARIERVQEPRSVVDLQRLLEQVLDAMSMQIRESKASIKFSGDIHTLRVDRKGFHRVFMNLIDNAIKYRREGIAPVIEINTEVKDGGFNLYIRDNGMGIKKEYQEMIFGLFQRANSIIEGTGVGLTISKRVVEAHGGRIWVESPENAGCCFCITLPLSLLV